MAARNQPDDFTKISLAREYCCRFGQKNRFHLVFEQQQVRQAAVPSGRRTFDVSGTQRPSVATAPVAPNALYDPCELNLVVGPALVNDGLQPCVAVKWARNACECL